MIIKREKDVREISEGGKWFIVYGRRKTGKSFLFFNVIDKFDQYYLVTRDGSVIDVVKNTRLSEEALEQVLPLLLREERTVIIDEFHRLPKKFFDFLQSLAIEKKGRLILITSTLHYYKEIIGSNSPILGVFNQKEVGLVDPVDALRNAMAVSENAVELAIALREPLTAEFSDKKDPLAWTVYYKKDTVSALLGEIFQEEERKLTNTYYAVLKAIAEGKNNPKEVGDYVKSLGLISTNSVVTSYLRNLEELKVVKRLRNAEKEEQRFIINSPLLDLYFYLDAKFGYSEVNVSLDKVIEVERTRIPFYVEDFVRELLGKVTDSDPNYYILRKEKGKVYEVDIVVKDRKRVKVIAEVKWRREVTRRDLEGLYILGSRYVDAKKIVVVPSKSVVKGDLGEVEVVTPEELLNGV